ncbi:MAG TPA: LacI family DNA-binding transcriptional regulator [Capsulimonadaceae bacterium]|jgi:LacI family transcriptional regulator
MIETDKQPRDSKPDRQPTLKDVAERAGVGVSTVSYVLANKPKSVGDDARARIWDAARALGYRPNMAARSLVTRRTNLIGLWVPQAASSFTAGIISHIQALAREDGYEVLIRELNTASTTSHALSTATWSVDGVIVFLGAADHQPGHVHDAVMGLPAVSMGALPLPGTDFVGVELTTASLAAVRHLAAIGRIRIGYLAPCSASSAADQRRSAYDTVIAECRQSPIIVQSPENTRASAYETVRTFLGSGESVDALFCYNDEAALGAYRALRDFGKRVAADVTLIGCDGIEDVEYLDWPLSTIVIPTAQMCATAWRYMAKRLATPNAKPVRSLFSARLELR